MGYKYTGDSVLGLSLTVNTPKPLDIRTVVENTEELYSIPKDTAYKGMTVANIANGNIYMLVGDQLNPQNPLDPSVPQQWKASYEAIQIVTCTQDEYKEWEQNTNNYVAIDPNKSYLREDVYYYIYEDSMQRSDKEPGDLDYEYDPDDLQSQAYVSYAQLQSLEKRVTEKASSGEVQLIKTDVNTIKTDLQNYVKNEELVSNYASLDYIADLINTENEESFISTILKQYYTLDEVDSKFVTQEWLKGSADGDDFVFVTKVKYDEDQANVQTQLNTTLKTEEDGSVKNLTVETLISSQDKLNVQTTELQVNSSKVALSSEVPVIEILDQSEFNSKLENKELEDDVYYYTYSENQADGIITNQILTDGYFNKTQINQLIFDNVNPLQQRISELERLVSDLTQRLTNLEAT